MFKDIYLRAFWSLTKKDPRAARVSKDAYPESSIVTSTRMSHAHLVNTSAFPHRDQQCHTLASQRD
eukprot:547216-Rhodomonas_salina.4